MARPRKEGMDYFPHDTDAVNDKKIEALRMLYGNDGYAFYFIILEMIYKEPTFELDVSDAETIQILSKKVGINTELFNQILQTAIKRDCFDKEMYFEEQVLTSNGIKKRAAIVVEKRDKMRESYKKKVSDAETPPEMPQSKVKVKQSKSKVKAVTEEPKIQHLEFVYLTEKEYSHLQTIVGQADLEDLMFELNVWLGNNPKKQKTTNCNLTLQNWHRRRQKEQTLRLVNGGQSYSRPSTTSRLQDLYKQAEEAEKREANGGY